MWTSLVLAALLACSTSHAAVQDTQAAVERAVLDYAESYYLAKPEYIERSVAPELDKLGYRRAADGSYAAHPMTYAQLHEMIVGIRDGAWKPEPGPKQVEVLDRLDQTALVKLTGAWGVDYMQLALQDGRWKTRHVLWQSAPPAISAEQSACDERDVESAVADYLAALYEAKPELIDRSVAPGLVKYGYWREPGESAYAGSAMSFDKLRALAGKWNAKGDPLSDAPRVIEVLDVMDQTACVKLTAQWGVDTMLLARVEGSWKILYVMWQSHPTG